MIAGAPLRAVHSFRVGFVAALLFSTFVSGQTRSPVSGQQLYLLAATPDGTMGYPSTLFRAFKGELLPVRDVLPQTAGLRAVKAWGNAIFLVHADQNADNARARAVTILHTNDPEREDDVAVYDTAPEEHTDFDYLFIASAQPNASAVDLLIPVADFTPGDTTLATISGSMGPKVRLNNWGEYAALRMEGDTGGPFLERNDFFVMPEGNGLAVKVWSHSALKVDSAPPASVIDKLLPLGSGRTARGQPGHRLQILVANQRYLLLGAEYPARTEQSSPTRTTEFFLHDRARNRWSELPVEGDLSRCRLFDPWLATTVVMDNPSQRPSPGKENERHITDRNELPEEYGSSARSRASETCIQSASTDRAYCFFKTWKTAGRSGSKRDRKTAKSWRFEARRFCTGSTTQSIKQA